MHIKEKKSSILTTACLCLMSLGLISCQQNKKPFCTTDINSAVVVPIIIEDKTFSPKIAHPEEHVQNQRQINQQLKTGQDVAALTQKATTANTVNIEKPARCYIPKQTSEIISDIPYNKSDFTLLRTEKNDELPRYEVNGYTFSEQPLDVALQALLAEANIKIYSDDGLFPEVSAQEIRGELSAVVDELANATEVYIRYNAEKKKLYLSRWAKFSLTVPGGTVGMYAVLDALRGADITQLQPDWGKNEIYFRITKPQENTITRLIDYLKTDPQLLMFDITVYQVIPHQKWKTLNWQDIVQTFGVKKVNMSVNGLTGRLIITDYQRNQVSLVNNLRTFAQLKQVSKGVAVMPSGWKVRFDIGQCSLEQTPEKDLSLLLQSSVHSPDRIESHIALDSNNGEITSFYSFYTIDDDLNIIGIPASALNNPQEGVEYLLNMKPRVLKLREVKN